MIKQGETLCLKRIDNSRIKCKTISHPEFTILVTNVFMQFLTGGFTRFSLSQSPAKMATDTCPRACLGACLSELPWACLGVCPVACPKACPKAYPGACPAACLGYVLGRAPGQVNVIFPISNFQLPAAFDQPFLPTKHEQRFFIMLDFVTNRFRRSGCARHSV